MASRLIVVDSVHPLVRQNRCFDPSIADMGPGHGLYVCLAQEAIRRGIEIATADVYLAMSDTSSLALCITDMVTSNTDKVLKKGARPIICMSLESPLVARRFYHDIIRYAGRFRQNFQFRGVKERLQASGTIFHPMYWPMDTRTASPDEAWSERSYLVLVNSNKRAVNSKFSSFKNMVRSVAVQTQFQGWRLFDPWMRIREIYVDRIKAIHYFSNYDDFRLYGIGWNDPIPGFGTKYRRAAQKAYAGPVDYQHKRSILGGFKFAICFENCAFPGYITEKIFDCFLAGCIPVYFGAPDITDFVPVETFIDFRQFRDMADLDQYLRTLSETEAHHYLDAARSFLSSTAFDNFHQDTFANELLNIIEQEN